MIDIFIRTYKNDLEWLNYCLKSIDKYLTGYRNIIVAIPWNQKGLLKVEGVTVIEDIAYQDDYLGQQICKLNAYRYSDAEFILFVDSDCVFFEETDLSKLLIDNKPILFKTHYDYVGEAICWKGVTEKFLGFPVEYEYMRRLPLLYRRDTLNALHNVFPDKDRYISSQPQRQFSEFNALGAFIEAFESEKYIIWDTIERPDLPKPFAKQFWSWGGVTEEIKQEIEGFLK